MRGASLWFARQLTAEDADNSRVRRACEYQLILCSGMMDVAALKALVPDLPPVLLYCHESQIVYPSQSTRDADLHFAFTDVVNMLAADKVLFNSSTHRSAFLDRLPGFLRHFPEFRPMWAAEEISTKSAVCYPGIEIPAILGEREPNQGTPLIIWNHRWEFDKNPQAFFRALALLALRDIDFEVAVLGENFKTVPREFTDARETLGSRIVHYGYVSDRSEYVGWITRGDVVVSTAIQENFGISVLEAVACGCFPVLPNRLSYPEIMPAEFHADVLYDQDDALADALITVLGRSREDRDCTAATLASHARSFSWDLRIGDFDCAMEETLASGPAARGSDS